MIEGEGWREPPAFRLKSGFVLGNSYHLLTGFVLLCFVLTYEFIVSSSSSSKTFPCHIRTWKNIIRIFYSFSIKVLYYH